MIGDLHCHTRLSDGSMSIDDLVFYAKRAGLDFVAITDHDTMEGVTRAAILGKRYGISVVAGVEVTCYDYQRGRAAHILCYLPDKPDRLQGMLGQTLENRNRAGQKMIRAVTRFYPVTEEHIRRHAAGSKSVYIPHIMQALVDLGYDDRIYGDTYELLFGRDGLCYRAAEYPPVHEAIELIHSAGGIAVLAHPPIYDSMDLLEELAEKNLLDGVEAYHHSISQRDASDIGEIADRYGLLRTGGSDFHGMYDKAPRPLASCITAEEDIAALFSYKKNAVR